MKQYYKIIDGQRVFFKNPLLTEDRQIFNPTEEMLLEAGWTEYVPPQPTAEELLQQAKDNKIAEIDAYDESDEVNSFTIDGQEMWLDVATRQQLRTSVEAYKSLDIENVTKWFNGVEYTFSTTQWLQMLDLLEVYAAEALNVTEAHKAAVNALDSTAAIEDYDITTGYPQKIEF